MFDNFVGQSKIVRELSAIIYGLKNSPRESLNILLRGQAGCGKTMLAEEFCKSIGGDYTYQLATKDYTLRRGWTNIRLHILDEIHKLRNFESLYPHMDSGRYVYIFCTTESGILPDPFTSRCLVFTFDDYSNDEIAEIVYIYATSINLRMEMDTAKLIANRARNNPRIAKKYTKRIKFIIERGYHPMTLRGIKSAFNDVGIFNGGYTDVDISYMKFLAKVGRASLNTISRSIGVDENTIINDVEPFLLDKGHIQISSRGRKFLGWEAEKDGGASINKRLFER